MMLIPANVRHEDFLRDLYRDEYDDYVDEYSSGRKKSVSRPDLSPEERKRVQRTRRQNLSREATLRAISSFFLCAGTVLMVTALIVLVQAEWQQMLRNPGFYLTMAFGGGLIAVALGLRKRRRWSQLAAGLISGLAALAFPLTLPLGTAASGLILFALFSQKGRNVFSDRHVFVVDATPDIKPPLWGVVWKLAVLASLVVIQGIITASFYRLL